MLPEKEKSNKDKRMGRWQWGEMRKSAKDSLQPA